MGGGAAKLKAKIHDGQLRDIRLERETRGQPVGDVGTGARPKNAEEAHARAVTNARGTVRRLTQEVRRRKKK
jgi:hypothetical protein